MESRVSNARFPLCQHPDHAVAQGKPFSFNMLALGGQASRLSTNSKPAMYSLPVHSRVTVPFRQEEKHSKHLNRKVVLARSHSAPQHVDFSLGDDYEAHRRELLAALVAAAVAFPTGNAEADQPTELIRRYYGETDRVHAALRDVLAVEESDPDKETKFDLFRDASNRWVGDYRRLMGMSKKSFADTYAAINALQGSFTTLGTKRGVPAKVRQYSVGRLEAAQKALQREKSRDPNYVA